MSGLPPRPKFIQNSLKRDESVGNGVEQSLKSLINSAGVSTLFGGGASYNFPNSNEASLDKIIYNFVSKQVRKLCYQKCATAEFPSDGNSPEMEKQITEAFAAVVMVDVSGYSKLTAALAERGPQGAELLSKTMKAYLDKIIKTIIGHGGDIVKFVGKINVIIGDAVIFCWRSEKAADLSDTSLDIVRGELVYTAAKCCVELLMHYGTFAIEIEDCPTKELRIHLGVGAGKIFDVVVGGIPGRWEHFIAGDGVNQLSVVLDLAKAGILSLILGELALSHVAIKYLRLVIDFNSVDLGGYDKRCIILKGVEKAKRIATSPEELADDDELFSDMLQLQASVDLYRHFVDRTAIFKLQADINQSKLFQMQSGLLELLNLTELRQVTTIFIKVGSLRAVKGDELLDASQEAITIVQNALFRCEGSLRQFHVDDKGAVILCFFGLPPLAHENDSSLGISAGIEIRDKFLDAFEEFSIGITTGVVSYGGVGAEGRSEYAVMGDAINMAARLMCLPDAHSAILCDEKTFTLCEGQFTFESLGEAHVKGKNTAISIFRPNVPIPESNRKQNQKLKTKVEIIGRETERKAIQQALDKVSTSDPAETIIIQAEGGQGLTSIVGYTKSEAIKRNANVCLGAGMEMEKSAPYYAFRGILYDIMGLVENCYHDPRTHALRLPSLVYAGGESPSAVTSPPISNSASISSGSPGKKPILTRLALLAIEEKKETGYPSSPVSMTPMTPSPGSALPSGLPKPTRRMSIAKPPKDDDDDDIGGFDVGTPGRQRFVATVTSVEEKGKGEELDFNKRARACLSKVDEDPDDAELLEIIMPQEGKETDLEAKTTLRHRTKDLVELLSRLLNVLSFENKIVLIISEAQWMDNLSWELLLELLTMNAKIGVFIFTRPEGSYESKENKVFFRRIQNLARSSTFMMEGLTLEETRQMIISTWVGQPITSVTQRIVDGIHKRTDGNPFFIRSLTVAMKDSGQWRVENSTLDTRNEDVDFEKLVLGYDNQSIILAQFDRLDRNFQLLLKVAAVLGQRFLLDDVLYFLTGMPAMFDRIERKSYSAIIRGIQSMDRYTFLTRESQSNEGVHFQFKSGVVRKCIYDNMVKQQRCQLHLNVAIFYESRLKDNNRNRYIVPIYEHYKETDDSHIKKKIHYLELVAAFYYEKNAMADAVRHYKELIRIVNEYQTDLPEGFLYKESSTTKWYIELGNALFIREDLADAEVHLLKALQLLGYPYPQNDFKMKWAISKELGKRKGRDAKIFASLPKVSSERLDYLSSYRSPRSASNFSIGHIPQSQSKKTDLASSSNGPANTSQENTAEGSSNHLHQTRGSIGGANGAKNQEPLSAQESSPEQLNEALTTKEYMTRQVLITLAELYRRTGNALRLEYAVVCGLNLGDNAPDLLTSRCFAIGAYVYWIKDLKEESASKYMEVADRLDNRSDIRTSIQVADNHAYLAFMQGKYDVAMAQTDVLAHLGNLSGYFSARIRGSHLRANMYLFCQSRSYAINAGRDCNALSIQKDSWMGQFWSTNDLLFALASSPRGEADVARLTNELDMLWTNANNTFRYNVMYQLSFISINGWVLIHQSVPFDYSAYFADVPEIMKKTTPYLSEGFMSFLAIGLTTAIAFQKGWIEEKDKSFIRKLCTRANETLKKMKALVIAEHIRRIYKGLIHISKNDPEKAVLAWKKGINEKCPAKYIQGVLYLLMGKMGPATDKNAKDNVAKGVAILAEIGSLEEFERVFGKLSA